METAHDKKIWNEFVLAHAPVSGAFLQSWEWGRVNERAGREVLRLRTKNAGAQIIRMPLPFGRSYFYIPRGPLGAQAESERNILRMLKQQYRSAAFVRYEPAREELYFTWQFKTRDIQPSTTWITNLNVSEESLLSAMHRKTRYNIRLSEKKGVSVKIGGADLLDAFYLLSRETAKRDRFRLHKKEHYSSILKCMNGSDGAPRAFIALAEHNGISLAANIMLDWNGTRTYLHGASSDSFRHLMAPHLLHWRLIQDAKSVGLQKYDWWGIAPNDATKHPLLGVTRFKKGFPGAPVSMPKAMDLVFHPLWYLAYRFLRKLSGK
ncbi:MAG: peptidoglycan bridge formation glycyltransferase FemA/FemB family protein [Patescibacteria group bacterium]